MIGILIKIVFFADVAKAQQTLSRNRGRYSRSLELGGNSNHELTEEMEVPKLIPVAAPHGRSF